MIWAGTAFLLSKQGPLAVERLLEGLSEFTFWQQTFGKASAFHFQSEHPGLGGFLRIKGNSEFLRGKKFLNKC